MIKMLFSSEIYNTFLFENTDHFQKSLVLQKLVWGGRVIRYTSSLKNIGCTIGWSFTCLFTVDYKSWLRLLSPFESKYGVKKNVLLSFKKKGQNDNKF